MPPTAGSLGCLASGTAGWSHGVIVTRRRFSDTLTIPDLPLGQVARGFSVAPHSYTAWRIPFSPDGQWIAFGGLRGAVPAAVSLPSRRRH